MKGKCIARHLKVDTPQRVCMVLEYPTEVLHGSGVPHRGFAWFWGTPHSFGMVLGYPTEGMHGYGVPHRGFT